MRRRNVLGVLGGAVAWPLAARSQQSAKPTIGLLESRTPEAMGGRLVGFRSGLKEAGFIDGENVSIVYRWAEEKYDRLPALAAELVRQRVDVIVTTGGPPAAFAAKAATKKIPIVFLTGGDPVKAGLVNSMARPNENLTGVNLFNIELEAKRLGFLHELVSRIARVAVFTNSSDAGNAEITSRDLQAAASSMGLRLQFFNVNTPNEIDAIFSSLANDKPDAVFFAAPHS